MTTEAKHMEDFGEPWKIVRGNFFKRDNWGIDDNDKERARQCVNACAGLPDEELRAVPHVGELLEALKDCLKDSFTAADGMSEAGKRSPAGMRYAKAVSAIASAEGREP